LKGRQPLTLYYHAPGLQPGTIYYWRVDEVEQDGVTVHTGDVWQFMTQAVTAYYPTPADKANDASLAPVLSWLPGVGATDHHLYFGGDLDAVTHAAAGADKGLLTKTTFAPTVLEGLTTYYWRVDEVVAGGAVKAGRSGASSPFCPWMTSRATRTIWRPRRPSSMPGLTA
jgi:hypothetical protein